MQPHHTMDEDVHEDHLLIQESSVSSQDGCQIAEERESDYGGSLIDTDWKNDSNYVERQVLRQ